MPSFYGKYRGKVANNRDPLDLGRVQVIVPAVAKDVQAWAMPCVPYAGRGVGFLAIPPVNANVWVEYEGGDPSLPIWSGCFWDNGEAPVAPAMPEVKIMKTEGIKIMMNDMPGAGALTIEVGPPVSPVPLKIVLDVKGIELTSGASVLRLTPSIVELLHAVNGLKLGPDAATLTGGPVSSLKVASTSAQLVAGVASVKLSPTTVSINDGALEVI